MPEMHSSNGDPPKTLTSAAAEVALGRRLVPFTDLMIEYAARDSRVCYVGVDTMDVEFRDRFPERAFDVGIAEQNQLGVATGLAKAGMIPVLQAWSPFTPIRNFDQLRTSLARHNSNVKIITTALGLINCSHGTTHHDLESVALYRVVPNLIVLAPFDAQQFEIAFRAAMQHVGPVILLGPPEIYAPGSDGAEDLPFSHAAPFWIGGSETLLRGSDIAIFSFGPALRYCWSAAQSLAVQEISASLINLYSLKPFDADAVRRAARETGRVLCVEEQLLSGGMGSAIGTLLAEEGLMCRFQRLGIPDRFVEELGNWTETREGIGLTGANVAAAAKKLVGEARQ